MKRMIKKIICLVIVVACLTIFKSNIFSDDNCKHEDFIPWNSNNTLPNRSGKYYLINDINLDEVQYIDGDNDISLCLNGHTITQNKAMSEVYILSDNATLSIYDCKAYGDYVNGYHAGVITGGKKSCIRMLDDVVSGKASKGATFNLYDGIIKDNNSIEYGGALCIEGHGNFNMYGGLFTNNVAYKCGGAVYAKDFSNVNLLGGAFTYNSSNQDGGAVYLYTASKGLVDGTTFMHNDCIYDGGGIYIEAVDTFLQIDSGTFKYNKSKTSGGGAVAIFTQGHMVLNNADIYENEAIYGGGIWIRKATSIINNVNVVNNKAQKSGGGIQAQGIDIPFQKDCLVLNNAYISNNSAPDGGGIFIGGTAKAYLNGGLIKNNIATNNGGGLYVGTLGYPVVGKVEIKNNNATNNGGGIYIQRGSKSFFDNTIITNNIADNAGGIYVNDDFNFINGIVKNNEAINGVGGVHIEKADYDGQSYYSTVVKMGGDIYIYDNKGNKNNLYIDENSIVNLTSEGISEEGLIGVSTPEKLSKVLIGKYNYKKSGNEYLISHGEEYIQDDNNVLLIICPIIIVLICLIIFINRKKIFRKVAYEKDN